MNQTQYSLGEETAQNRQGLAEVLQLTDEVVHQLSLCVHLDRRSPTKASYQDVPAPDGNRENQVDGSRMGPCEHSSTDSCPLPGREACASDGKPASPHESLTVGAVDALQSSCHL